MQTPKKQFFPIPQIKLKSVQSIEKIGTKFLSPNKQVSKNLLVSPPLTNPKLRLSVSQIQNGSSSINKNNIPTTNQVKQKQLHFFSQLQNHTKTKINQTYQNPFHTNLPQTQHWKSQEKLTKDNFNEKLIIPNLHNKPQKQTQNQGNNLRQSANPAFFASQRKNSQKLAIGKQMNNGDKLSSSRHARSYCVESSDASKSSQDNVEQKKNLNVPTKPRPKTHSLLKQNCLPQKTKIPKFIKEKERAKSQRQGSVKNQTNQNNNKVNYQVPPIWVQQQYSEGFQIKISIKPALKKKLSIDDFLLIEELGEGSFGKAFLAMQKHINFLCVLKLIEKDKLTNFQINNLIRQIKIQSFLQHKHLTGLYGYFYDEEKIYLVLQLLPTGNLKERIKHQPANQKFIASVMAQICSGIGHMHEHLIMHRDIKPENIFTFDNYIKIGDFGCAVYTDITRTSFVGSPCYLSPEQLKNQNYGDKVDMWEIGTLAYELLFRVCPFQKDILEMIQGVKRQPNLSELRFPKRAQVSEQTKDFLIRSLDKNPDTRMSLQQALTHRFVLNASQQFDLLKCLN